MPKAEFPNMGLPEDFRQRESLKRIDNKARNDLVRDARSIIYADGRAVTSPRVEKLLKPYSYVPTNVSSHRFQWILNIIVV